MLIVAKHNLLENNQINKRKITIKIMCLIISRSPRDDPLKHDRIPEESNTI